MKIKNGFMVLSLAVIGLSIFAPSEVAKYTDNNIINKIYEKEDGFYTRSFIYDLPHEEKLFMLTSALQSRAVPASDLFNSVNPKRENNLLYSYLPVYDSNLYKPQISQNSAFGRLLSELRLFEEKGVIPDFNFDKSDLYNIELYSVTDVTNPEFSFVLWQVTYNKSQPLAMIKNVILEAYMDGDTGKLYYFSLRTENTTDGLEPRDLALFWQDYLGLSTPSEIENQAFPSPNKNEKRYKIDVSGHGEAVMDMGFSRGVNESFILPIE